MSHSRQVMSRGLLVALDYNLRFFLNFSAEAMCGVEMNFLDGFACVGIDFHEFIPRIFFRIFFFVLYIYPANGRPACIYCAYFLFLAVVTAGAITTIKKLSLVAQVNMLATQATLGAGKF